MRHIKLYKKEIDLVRNMGPGDLITFETKHPWGLAKKIYKHLKEWMSEKYYDITVDYNKSTVKVKKEALEGVFIYDDDMNVEEHKKLMENRKTQYIKEETNCDSTGA